MRLAEKAHDTKLHDIPQILSRWISKGPTFSQAALSLARSVLLNF